MRYHILSERLRTQSLVFFIYTTTLFFEAALLSEMGSGENKKATLFRRLFYSLDTQK